MAETDPKCLTCIICDLRDRLYRHAAVTAQQQLNRSGPDAVMQFFKAFAVLNEGHVQEAVRDLSVLRERPQVALCSLMALICAHRQTDNTEREAVSELDCSLKASRRTAGDEALYYAALLYWILGRNEKAKEYTERMLKVSGASSQGLILKGWIFLTSDNDVERSQAIRYFDSGTRDSKNVFGLMGKAEYFMVKQNQSRALETLNQIIASSPDFIPALILKMNLFMSLHNWDQTTEMAERILQKDAHNLKALQMMTIISAVKDSDMNKVKEYLQLFLNAVEVTEPNNPNLHVEVMMPISRLLGHDKEVVQMLMLFVQRVASRSPGDPAIAAELGYLLTLQEKYKEAHKWYTKALNTDPSSVAALGGIIRCELMSGQVEEAAQQLEFLNEVQQSIGHSSEVPLLQAIVAQKRGAAEESVVLLLKEATERHLQALRGLHYGVDYLQRLDVNFLLQVVSMHLANTEDMPHDAGLPTSFGLKHSSMILEAIIKAAPRLLAACYHMAHVKFLSGDQASAQHFLELCMEKDPSMCEIHLLQAKLHLHAGDHSRCLNSLESGVSVNFKLRQMPQYYVMKARALKAAGELGETVRCLRAVMSMPGVRRVTAGHTNSVSQNLRLSVFLELADALRLNGEQHEATLVVQDAICQFRETPEEMRVVLVNVDLALGKDDVKSALNMLHSITPNHSNYTQAKEKMAKIYLERQRNPAQYIACYREIHEHLPGPRSAVLLADAFMQIQEPEKAIELYEEAVKLAPKDGTLAKKIGQVLVRTHQYDKAISYFEAALNTSIQGPECLELAELLLKMKSFERAQQILEKALDHEDSTDLTTMMNDVKLSRVLVKVLRARSEPCMDRLQQVCSLQQKIVRRFSFEHSEARDKQRRLAADVFCDQAHEFHLSCDLEKAKQCYSEALTYWPEDTKINFQIAQLYYEHHKLDYCEDQCLKILQNDENHTATIMLFADVLLRKNQKEEAIKQYTNIIHQQPENFHALAKFLHMLRWVGRLDDILPFFKMIESRYPTAASEAGYNYCKGLYYWHAYQVKEALLHLSRARKDSEWGEETVELMVQICLNPDKVVFGGEVFQNTEEGQTGSSLASIFDGGRSMALDIAQNLLKEFQPRTKAGQERVNLLHNLCLVHSEDPKQIEKAVLDLSDMVAKNVMLEASLLVAAQAFLQLKQSPRARNFLKRVSKAQWTHATADHLETSCLLLADMYIKMGKYTNAEKHLDDCIRNNKSCSRAYEYKGFMMENEQRYKEAADLYEEAWRYSYSADPAVGYRLAFNYLKCKKCTQSIDVCYQVLQEHPDYPQIKDEVLNRAQLSLRP